VLNQAVIVVVQVVGVAAFLHFWGVGLYGEWLVLFAVPSYLSMSDVGFTSAIANEMIMLTARNHRGQAGSLFQTGSSLLLRLSLVLPVLVVVVAVVAPTGDLLNLDIIGESSLALILFLFTIEVLLTLLGDLLYAGFACEGHYGTGTIGLSMSMLLEFVGILTVLILGGGAVAAAAAMVIGRLFGVVGMRVRLKQLVPWLKLKPNRQPFREARHLIGPALASGAFPLGYALNLEGMVLAVSAALGPVSVAVFSTTRTLTRFGMQLLRVIWSVTTPEISAAYGARNEALLRLIHRRSCQVSAWIAGAFVLGMAVFAGPVLNVWTAGEIPLDRELLYLLLAVVFVNSLWYVSLSVLFATNRHERVAVDYVIGSMLSLPLAYVLITPFGLSGAAIALLALEIFMTAAVVPRTVSSAGDRLSKFVQAISEPPVFILRRGPAALLRRRPGPVP
jgi:O-antigen/teichoic acid export membrane protein